MVAMPGISLALPLFFKRKYGSFQFNGANVNIDDDRTDFHFNVVCHFNVDIVNVFFFDVGF